MHTMKLILTAALSATLGALAFGLVTDPEGAKPSQSPSKVISFSSEDGTAVATLVSEKLFEETGGLTSPSVYRLFGAYLDKDLGMVGSALQSFGTYKGLGADGGLPMVFTLDLGDWRFQASPTSGDWGLVEDASDLDASFELIAE